jgi:hypothetical protein
LDVLPAEKRLELINQRQQNRHQTLNSVGILFGVVFTAGSLIATALTVRHTQDELRSTKEGQITDRYTKAVEQLGSNKRDVRLGAIYALERIAADSERDRPTIIAVLAAFAREHDPAPKAKLPAEPDTDVQAALTVLGRRPQDPSGEPPHTKGSWAPGPPPLDLHGIRTPDIQLLNANLTRVNLFGADLGGATLVRADLGGAILIDAKLGGAYLFGAKLGGAYLTRADLRGTFLGGANLLGANLVGADLRGADLRGADLRGADLRGADLRGFRSMSRDEIRKQARTDSTTRL